MSDICKHGVFYLGCNMCADELKRKKRMTKFAPWDRKDFDPASPTITDITSPPCSTCIDWHPQHLFTSVRGGYEHIGVRLCWAPNQCRDFSCYKEKK